MSSVFSANLSARMPRSMTVVGAPHSDSVDKTSAEGLASITRQRSSSMAPVARTLPKDLQAAPLTTEPQQATAKVTASLNKARDAGVPDAPSRPSLWQRLLSPENVMMAGAVLIALSGGAAAMPVFCLMMVMVIGNRGDSTASHGVGPAIASSGDPTPPMPKAGKDDTALTEQRHRDSVAQQQLLDQLPDPSSAMESMTRAEQDSADYNVEHPQHAWQREEVSQQARLFAELASKQAASALTATAVNRDLSQDARESALASLLKQLADLKTDKANRLADARLACDAFKQLTSTEREQALLDWPTELLYLAASQPGRDTSVQANDAAAKSEAQALVDQIGPAMANRLGGILDESGRDLLNRGRLVGQDEMNGSLHDLANTAGGLVPLGRVFTKFSEVVGAAGQMLADHQEITRPLVGLMHVNGNHWVSVIVQRDGDSLRFDAIDTNHRANEPDPAWVVEAKQDEPGTVHFKGMALQHKLPNACGPLQSELWRHLAAQPASDGGRVDVSASLSDWKQDWDKLGDQGQDISVSVTRAGMMGALAKAGATLNAEVLPARETATQAQAAIVEGFAELPFPLDQDGNASFDPLAVKAERPRAGQPINTTIQFE